MMVGPFGLPPDEALQWFRSKGYQLTEGWQDMWQEEHAKAFTVAKATQLDVLADIRQAVDDALSQGLPLAQFKKQLTPVLQKKGWWGEKEDPETGEVVQLGSARRLRTIYETNLRMAHAAGRWERIERTAQTRPYLRYVAILDGRERDEHRKWHGTILPWDHPWWKTHNPPNGWGCRCKIMQLSERDLERYGLKVSAKAPPSPMVQFERKDGARIFVPKGVSPGFAYNPGTARRGWEPADDVKPLKPLKSFGDFGRPAAKDVQGRTPAAERWDIPDSAAKQRKLKAQFVELFGSEDAAVKDPTGDETLFSGKYLDYLFSKGAKGDQARASFVPVAKQTAEQPYEIWLMPVRNPKTGVVSMRKRYIGLFEERDFILVADKQPSGYMAWTSFPRSKIDSLREGQLVYAAA